MSEASEPLIEVKKVGKIFCRNLKRSLWYGLKDSITELNPGHQRKTDSHGNIVMRKDEFWANQDVSFKLHRGECLGLIGHNGAGKTTILKMLNGLIKPDSGSITMRGKVGALIALGAGFNPILSGRENVYVNGSVLGLSRKEIEEKFEEIVQFAEIDKSIDAPVQTYSSGMKVRLGFAIASAIEPDILLIDEVLAVGDLQFRMKCIQRISDLIRKNTAVVIVSHSMIQIQRVCTRTIVLNRGRLDSNGSVSEGIARYDALALAAGTAPNQPPEAQSSPVRLERSAIFHTRSPQEDGMNPLKVTTGQSVSIQLDFVVTQHIPLGRIRVYLESPSGEILSSITSFEKTAATGLRTGAHKAELCIREFPFLLGAYALGVSIHGAEHSILMESRRIGVIEVIAPEVRPSARTDAGTIRLKTTWSFR